jgi:hypothetical protein
LSASVVVLQPSKAAPPRGVFISGCENRVNIEWVTAQARGRAGSSLKRGGRAFFYPICSTLTFWIAKAKTERGIIRQSLFDLLAGGAKTPWHLISRLINGRLYFG